MEKSPHHYNTSYHQLPPDCIHLIFHYHLFKLRIQYDSISDYSSVAAPVPNLSSTTTPSPNQNATIFRDSDDWEFMQIYAHCVKIFLIRNHEPEHMTSLPLNEFLYHCRNGEHRQTFHYLAFSHLHYGLNPDLLRGVKKLDLGVIKYPGKLALTFVKGTEYNGKLNRILRNLVGIESLDLRPHRMPLKPTFFKYLRGIQKLKLEGYNMSDPNDTKNVFENLRGVRHLSLKGCKLSCGYPFLQDLRGIDTLEIEGCGNMEMDEVIPLSEQDLRNLRGIRKLFVHDNVCLTDEISKHLPGIEELSICCPQDGDKLTDRAFRNLRGIRSLHIFGDVDYGNISDEAVVNLRGIRSLTISRLSAITDSALVHLRGIKEFCCDSCKAVEFSADALGNLRGVRHLDWSRHDAGPSQAEGIHLNEECLKHLRGVDELHLRGVVQVCADAFRHLKHLSVLDLHGPVTDSPFHTWNIVLNDAALSHLENVRQVILHRLRLGIRNFPRLILMNMPLLETFEVIGCYILKFSKEGVIHGGAHNQQDENDAEYATFTMSFVDNDE